MQRPMTFPSSTFRAATSVVVPCRLSSCVIVAQPPFFMGKRGWVRSRAWIWLFSIDRQHHGVVWRIDVKADDVVDLRREMRIVGQLEVAAPVRLPTVPAPDALYRTDADAACLGHEGGRPMRSARRRIAQRGSDHACLDLVRKRRDPQRPRLVTQPARDPLGHDALLPPPDRGLAEVGVAHDPDGAAASSRQQHDLRSPDMLLWAVPIREDRLQLEPIGSAHFNSDTSPHAMDSHPSTRMGIQNRTLSSDFIH